MSRLGSTSGLDTTIRNEIDQDSGFLTNTVKTDSGNTYVGEEKKSGEWRFKKITSTNDFTYATVVNNPTKTSYALAYASYTTLTYGDPTDI